LSLRSPKRELFRPVLGITADIDKGVDYDNAECGALHGATFPNGLPKAGDDALPLSGGGSADQTAV
jgi:hypothetical protein